jgi:hypothetical protein
MGTISVEFDATGSAVGGGNPDGTAYQLSTANGYSLLGFEAPEPEDEFQWASSADTEGERLANQRPHNRTSRCGSGSLRRRTRCSSPR